MRRPWIRPLIVAGALVGATLSSARALPALATLVAQPARPMAASADSGCSAVISRTVAPDGIRTCEHCTVGLQVRPRCQGDPLNVVLVLQPWANHVYAQPACRAYTTAAIDSLEMSGNPNTKVGIVYLRGNGSILLNLTNDEQQVRDKARIKYLESVNPDLCYACGFGKAAQVLARAGRGERNIIVFIGPATLETAHPWYRDWVQGARTAKAAADTFVVGCPWIISCKLGSDWWRQASSGYYFEGTSPGAFAPAIAGLAARAARSKLAALHVDERVPANVTYVDGSASPPPSGVDATSGRLRWDFAAPITDTITITYRAQPLLPSPASFPVTTSFVAGLVALTDTSKLSRIVPIPTSVLTITGPCEPIVTPSPTPTDTPPPTPTDVPPPASSTPTSVPTATATPAPVPLYLPVSLREDCRPDRIRIDAALVLDASLSMLEPAGNGQTKLDAARSAALAFLDAVHLDAGDQAAVVVFNHDATVLQGLTSERQALSDALAAIAPAHQTRIDLGVAAATNELLGARHRPTNQAVMIVLTDGRADPVGPEAAIAAARTAKDAGVVVFTVGLGADVDAGALEAMASRAGYYFASPGAGELAGIYRGIAVTIPCPGEGFWGRR